MSNNFRKLTHIETEQVSGGIGIGPGGRDFGENPDMGIGGGSPVIPVSGGGDWWYPLPGVIDPNPIKPIIVPEPGKP